MMDWNKVLTVALDNRIWVEEIQEEYKYPYNMCGLCAISAGRMFKGLKDEGFDPIIHYASWDHVFVSVKGHVVDVTATQFDEFAGQRIVIEPLKKLREHQFYLPVERFDTVVSLIRRQAGDNPAKSKWPRHQVVPTRN